MKVVLNYLFENYHMSLFAVTNIFALFNLKMTWSGDRDGELDLKMTD